MSRNLLVTLGAAVIAVIPNLFFFHPFGVTGAAFFLFLLYSFISIIYVRKMPFSVPTAVLLVSMFAFLLLSIFRTTSIIQSLLLGMSFVTAMFLTYLSSNDRSFFSGFIEIFVAPFVLFVSYISTSLNGIVSVLGKNGKQRGLLSQPIFKSIAPVLTGVIIAFPIIALLLMLFSSADPIFAKTFQNVFKDFSLSELTLRIIFSAVLFCIVLPLGFFAKQSFSLKQEVKLAENARQPIIVMMILIALTLSAFLAVQWPYVFARVARETDLSKFGIATYSEYVKRGFTEFLMIATIIYSTIWLGLLAYRGSKNKKALFIVQTLVVGLFYVFLLSIGRRILLYWDFHGLSLVRVYGGMFLVWVAGLTLFLWLRHIIRFRFVTLEVVGTILFVAFLGFWNAEHFILHNHPPTVNDHVDYVYISRLSADGYDGWIEAYKKAKQTVENPTFFDKKILEKNDRRELAYAGMILGNITNQYHTLLNRYGSDDELKNYTDALFEHEIPKINPTAQLMRESFSIISRQGNTATTAADPYINPGREFEKSTIFRDSADSLSIIASAAASLRLPSETRKTGNSYIWFTPRSSYQMAYSLDSGMCGNYYVPFTRNAYPGYACVPSFYMLEKSSEPQKQRSFLDRIYVWNGAEAHALRRLQNDISLGELLSVQDKYFSLLLKVYTQPKEERSVEWDISLNAPFVL